jgi:hypothetical protein
MTHLWLEIIGQVLNAEKLKEWPNLIVLSSIAMICGVMEKLNLIIPQNRVATIGDNEHKLIIRKTIETL